MFFFDRQKYYFIYWQHLKLRWDTKNKDVTFNLELKSQIPVVSTFTWYELKYNLVILLNPFFVLNIFYSVCTECQWLPFFAWSSQWSEICSPAYYRVSIFTISLYYIYWFFFKCIFSFCCVVTNQIYSLTLFYSHERDTTYFQIPLGERKETVRSVSLEMAFFETSLLELFSTQWLHTSLEQSTMSCFHGWFFNIFNPISHIFLFLCTHTDIVCDQCPQEMMTYCIRSSVWPL